MYTENVNYAHFKLFMRLARPTAKLIDKTLNSMAGNYAKLNNLSVDNYLSLDAYNEAGYEPQILTYVGICEELFRDSIFQVLKFAYLAKTKQLHLTHDFVDDEKWMLVVVEQVHQLQA